MLTFFFLPQNANDLTTKFHLMKKHFTILVLCAFYFSNLCSLTAQTKFEKAYWDSIKWVTEGLVQPALDGGYALFGWSGLSFEENFCLIKVDVNGDVQWAKNFGDSIRDFGYGFSQASDSGYIMVGQEYDWYGDETPHLYLIKCDKNGNLQWSKYYDTLTTGKSVLQTHDGGYIIAGYRSSYESFIMKTDSYGNPEWTKNYSPMHCNNLQKTIDQGYIMTGAINSPSGTQSNVSLIKIDDAGNLQWSKSFGSLLSDEGQTVKQTTDHGYIIAGETRSFGAGDYDVYLLKTDSNGNLQWSMTYGNIYLNHAYDVEQTEDGGYIVVAQNFTATTNMLLLKTDSTGNLQWSKQWGPWDNIYVLNILVSSQNTFLISGHGQDYYYEDFLLNIDTDDCLIENVDVTAAAAASFDTTGAIADTGSLTAHPAGAHEYIQQIIEDDFCVPQNINEIISSEPTFQIYPNPVSSQLNISFNNYYQPGYLIITNFLGETLKDGVMIKSENSIDVSQLPYGVYLATIKTPEGNFVKKFVRQ